MPLEQQVQSPRTYQRQCGGTRQQPYSLPTRLSGARSRSVTIELTTPERDASVRVPYEQLAKRHGTCFCTTYNGPLQTDDVTSDTSLGDEAEESQRLSAEQRPQTNCNRSTWRSENSVLRPDPNNRSTHSIPTIERHVISFPPDSSTTSSVMSERSELSILPNVVPMSHPSELPQSVAFVINSNRTPPDAAQSEYEQSAPACEKDSFRTDEPDHLTNHDRSIEDYTSQHVQHVDWASSRASYRLCRLSMPGMGRQSAQARQVAHRVIRHARSNKAPDERALWCPNCKQLPVLPVTGQCGHTRCTKCIQDIGACPCGAQPPKNLHVNTLVQELIKKLLEDSFKSDVENRSAGEQPRCARKPTNALLPVVSRATWRSRRHSAANTQRTRIAGPSPYMPMTPQARFTLARRQIVAGRHRDAASHLARVAATYAPLARVARALLAQCITVLSKEHDSRGLARALCRAVRAQASGAWLRARDLECVLCYHAYSSPVTTPCGHTYCRTCIERSMDYRKSCALCLRSLENFDLATTRDTVFVSAVLESIDALKSPPPPEPDVIPIFVCTVAYPAVPCPLFIFDPRYWLMIRRVLESGSRKFGMVAYERDRSYSDYGTVLEVCDCVHLEDGRSILSTVGVSRFRVIDRDVRDGCDVARIEPLTDVTPTEELVIWELRILATQISYKALMWLNNMSAKVRCEIEAAFGHLPRFELSQEWWTTPDGPAWLWWLIAILPLRSEIKILILSTKSLVKRMMAVSRTLEAIEQAAVSAKDCALLSSTDDWLDRSA